MKKGSKMSEEQKRKIGEANKISLKGLKKTIISIKRMRKTWKEKIKAGYKIWNKGKKLSEEHKKRIKIANTGKKHTLKSKKKMSLNNRGKKSHFWGKHLTKEAKEKLSRERRMERHWNWQGGKSKEKGYYKKKRKEWSQKNTEKIRYYILQRRKRKLKAKGKHSIEQWKQLKEIYNYSCAACLKQEPNILLTEDHIIPLTLGGRDDIENIQPLCRSCNSRKHTKIIKYII